MRCSKRPQGPVLLWPLLFLSAVGALRPAGRLTWSDEFNGRAGAAPDPGKWVHDVGNTDSNGWGNWELEYYTNSTQNAALDGKGNLVLTAHNVTGSTRLSCYYGSCNYTSARLTTANRFSQQYGRFEARIKIPGGQGMWPAFWMLGNGFLNGTQWPYCGEIDVMENVGKLPSTVYGSLHGPDNYGPSNSHNLSEPLSGAFHVYAVDWTPDYVAWYLDGTRYAEDLAAEANSTQWVFNSSPFYMLLNLAVGGTWPGSPDASTVFPARMLVDYVRVYSLAD